MSLPQSLLRPALLLTTVAVLVTGCSMPELAYRNAGWLIPRYADDYVELTEARKAHWKPILERELARHRHHELPLIVGFLRRADRAAADGLSAGETACLGDGLMTIYQRNARAAARIAAPLLASLTPEELPQLREAFREHNADYRDEYLDGSSDSRLDQRVDRFVDQVERWTGWLRGDQKALVRSHVERWPDLAPDWHAYRHEQQQRLLRLLAGQPDPARIESFLADWWGHMGDAYPALRDKRRRLATGVSELLVLLSTTFDAEQQSDLARNLGGLAKDFAALVPEQVDAPIRLSGSVCTSIDSLLSWAATTP